MLIEEQVAHLKNAENLFYDITKLGSNLSVGDNCQERSGKTQARKLKVKDGGNERFISLQTIRLVEFLDEGVALKVPFLNSPHFPWLTKLLFVDRFSMFSGNSFSIHRI